ncbi:hypothetical protein [Streptomyces jumonjinensis]|uniref:Uncharacterized protein n=1 Tax=Streptomyces jumonjinensis TaxID=1945 RepID=A0A646KA14_STRJU|nr:hypothetical protein [Streptomyces jumonjinensis]MQS99041.1 hypothetical protein [Streptomyces jumonjinensis]
MTTDYRWTASYWDGRTTRDAHSTLTAPANATETDVRAQALSALRRSCLVDMVFTLTIEAIPTSNGTLHQTV